MGVATFFKEYCLRKNFQRNWIRNTKSQKIQDLINIVIRQL